MDEQLYHYGIKGQKWGVRRYQNPDGSLTEEGKARIRSSGSHYWPKYDGKNVPSNDKHIRNRMAVSNKFDKDQHDEYTKIRNRYKTEGYSDEEATKLTDIATAKKNEKRLQKYIEEFANATLNDLGLKNTPQARAFVMEYLEEFEHSETEVDSLIHWGIKGMKWGRRRYQNKDGSLTPEGRKRYGDGDGDSQAETTEQKRARLLKSTNAKELYKDRDVLTTQEIQERLKRIEWEQSLAKAAADLEPKKKSIGDYIDKALTTYKKADNAYKTLTESTMGKKLLQQLGLEKEKAEAEDFNLESAMKKLRGGKLSAKDTEELQKRLENEKKIYDTEKDLLKKKKAWDDARDPDKKNKDADESKKAKELKKAMEEYEAYQQKLKDDLERDAASNDSSGTYRMSNRDIKDSKLDTKERQLPAVIQNGMDIVDKYVKSETSYADIIDTNGVNIGQTLVTSILEEFDDL